MSLFPQPVFVIVGPTCAGKTTLAEYMETNSKAQYIEASSIVRLLVQEHDIPGENDFERAKVLLDTFGMGVVADTILSKFSRPVDSPMVISGFRTIEELQVLKTHGINPQIVLVSADEKTRFSRQLHRGRGKVVRTLEEFRAIDDDQRSLGLLPVAEEFADYHIVNEGTLDEFYASVNELTSLKEPSISHRKRQVRSRQSQLYRCLKVLSEARRPMSTDEIGALTGDTGIAIRHNNVNKVLRQAPGLVRRLENGARVRYEILTAGAEFVRLVEEQG